MQLGPQLFLNGEPVSAEFKEIKVDRPRFPVPEREIPPYNGFGSYEDSLGNCDSLMPKPPKKDFLKFMEKDRYLHYLHVFLPEQSRTARAKTFHGQNIRFK